MKVKAVDDALVIRACELFLSRERWSATHIAERLNAEREYAPPLISREDVYALIGEARSRRLLQLLPSSSETLEKWLSAQFHHPRETIHVSSVQGEHTSDFIAQEAARFTLELIRKRGSAGGPVNIGFGGGRTIMKVAEELASLMHSADSLPDIGIHVLSSGFDVENPSTAPVTFLGFFNNVPTRINSVALFTTPFVDAEHYEAAKLEHGFKRALDLRHQIHIIITSLSCAHDPHGALIDLERVNGEKGLVERLKMQNWVGDVGYLPFSAAGPLQMTGKRSVSLFDLDELVQAVATQEREVVLVAGPCPQCGRLRNRPLRPLLENEALKVWSHVFLDHRTAQALKSTAEQENAEAEGAGERRSRARKSDDHKARHAPGRAPA